MLSLGNCRAVTFWAKLTRLMIFFGQIAMYCFYYSLGPNGYMHIGYECVYV